MVTHPRDQRLGLVLAALLAKRTDVTVRVGNDAPRLERQERNNVACCAAEPGGLAASRVRHDHAGHGAPRILQYKSQVGIARLLDIPSRSSGAHCAKLGVVYHAGR